MKFHGNMLEQFSNHYISTGELTHLEATDVFSETFVVNMPVNIRTAIAVALNFRVS
jgi:hypothetical protein